MSSAPARRSSYHLDVDRRLAMKQVQRHAQEHDQQQQQQQPSPHTAVKKTTIQEDEDATEDNNQEESAPSPRSVTRRVALRVSAAATAEVSSRLAAVDSTTTAKATFKSEKTAQLRKLTTPTATTTTTTSEPPRSTVVRLHQENAALKLQIVQLSNQHETQLQAVQLRLVEAQSAHAQAEHALKNQIMQLEIQQAEATANAHTYQRQIESLTLQLRAMEHQQAETKQNESQEQQPSFTATSSSLATPPERESVVKQLFAKRRGNGSPLPYGKVIKNGSGGNGYVKPFAWRDHAAESTTNQYRMAHFSPSPVTPVTARYVSVSPQYPEQGSRKIHAAVNELPSPFPEHQCARSTTAPLVKTPSASASLLSYCSDMLSSKLTLAASPSPSHLKVMPAWKAEQQQQQKQQQVWQHEKTTTATGTTGTAPVASELPLPGDFTAITMPPMGFTTTGAASASI